jgi:hypothetical protein
MNLWLPARQFYPKANWHRGRASGEWYEAPEYDALAWGADLNNDRYFLPALGSEMLTNWDLGVSPALGSELVSNGDFASDTVWTKTGFTISGGVASVNNPGVAATITQPVTLTPGSVYKVTFTLTSATTGTVNFGFTGGSTVSSSNHTVAGTYDVYLTAVSGNDTFRAVTSTSAVLSIDNISLKEITNYASLGWIPFGNAPVPGSGNVTIADVAGVDGQIQFQNLPFSVNGVYKLSVVVSAVNASGSVAFRAGPTPASSTTFLNSTTTISAPGTYTYHFVSTGLWSSGVVAVLVSGTNTSIVVDSVSLKEVITTPVGRTYGAELVTGGDFPTTQTLGSELATDSLFATGTGWSFTGTGASITGGNLVVTGDASNPSAYQTITTVVGAAYRVGFQSTAVGGGGSSQLRLLVGTGGADSSQNLSVDLGGSAGTPFIDFVATGTSTTVSFKNAAGASGSFTLQDMTFKEITNYSSMQVLFFEQLAGAVSITGGGVSISQIGSWIDVPVTTVSGTTYEVSFNSTVTQFLIYCGTTQAGVAYANGFAPIVGVNTFRFKATATTAWLRFYRNGGGGAIVDDISIKPITANGVFPKRSATFTEFFAYVTTSDVARTYVGNDDLIHHMGEGANMVSSPEDFTVWTKGNITTTANDTAAPTGAVTAERCTITASAQSTNRIYRSMTATTQLGWTLTWSVYAKYGAGGATHLWLQTDSGAGVNAVFNLTNGTHTSTATIATAMTDEGNGWYRCSMTYVSTLSSGSPNHFIWMTNRTASSSPSPALTAGDYIWLWGAQCEFGALTAYKGGTSLTGLNSARWTWKNGKRQLLLENAATNLLARSQEFGTTHSVTGLTLASDNATAPDGLNTADRLTDDGSNGVHKTQINNTPVASTAHTLSVFIKPGTQAKMFLGSAGGSSSHWAGNTLIGANFDVGVGTVAVLSANAGSTAAVEAYPNGWYRLSVTATTSASPGLHGYGIFFLNAANATSYVGDGTSYLHIWGMQLEAQPFASSYINTGGATITRNVETCRLAPEIEAILARTSGTVVARFDLIAPIGDRRIVGMDSNNTFIYAPSVATTVSAYNGSAVLTATLGGAGSHLNAMGAASAFDVAGRDLAANGGTVVTDSSPGAGTRTTIYLARPATVGVNQYGDGCYDFIGGSPDRLPANDLQALAVAA